MYLLNKIVGFATNPFCVGMTLMAVGLLAWRVRRVAFVAFGAAFAWLWLWSMPATCLMTGALLERPWLDAGGRVPSVASYPEADVIVLLSGGMCANTNISDRGEICAAGDRARFAAQLYRAGKAPRLVLTGADSRASTVPFLRELGVPEEAIAIDDDSRNTEENARFTARLMGNVKARVLLVTSAFHLRRSVLMFEKYAPGLTVVPVASDFEVLSSCGEGLGCRDFLPDGDALARNAIHMKEFVGYWGYRLFRR